ncbi:hypothetical protein [Pseudonocardia humida]|uniref:Uncharacterized protein n=1 Tax=Pseudonocardia humida TaxID=2800819 RepID=A0ABT1AD82_9PSEU|nr:hypothetical protein [Pseudonocardia humida]MCO1660973.1 hypothetical protein [Pseudonocardia humida]
MRRHADDLAGEPPAGPGGREPAEVCALAASALREAARLVAELTPEQLVELAAGRARFAYETTAGPPGGAGPVTVPTQLRPARRAPAAPSSDVVGTAVLAIRELHTPGEVAEHLGRHRYPVPTLKQIARALGPTVSTAARNRADLERNIVEGTAGYRTRSAAMSGGAWS